MIRALSVTNLRSLGDVHVDLGPMTVLVGPNGSGKGNVVDALRIQLVGGDARFQGAVRALQNIALYAICSDTLRWLPWAPPIRWPNLHLRRGIDKGVSFIRAKPDAGALLILRDEDDACPATRGPEMAGWVREHAAPFPVAVVLLGREFETLFLPCVDLIAGRPIVGADGHERAGLLPDTRFEGERESVRGVKEWLSSRFPQGRVYEPKMDQLPMTRMLDLDRLRSADVPSFGTLERSLGFLADRVAEPAVCP